MVLADLVVNLAERRLGLQSSGTAPDLEGIRLSGERWAGPEGGRRKSG